MAQISQDELRRKRHQLYKNPVFLVTHEALRPLLHSLDIVELFDRAEAFTQNLLECLPIDRSLMEYEVEDIREDITDTADCQLVLILTFVKLRALRCVHDEARALSHVLLAFCQEYDGFRELMGDFIAKERLLRHQGRLGQLSGRTNRGNLCAPCSLRIQPCGASVRQEPLSASVAGEELAQAGTLVARFVDNCLPLTPDAIQQILVPLMSTNEQYENAFDAEVNKLKERLSMKTNTVIHPLVQGDLVMNKQVDHEVNGVEKGGTGVFVKKMALASMPST